MRTLGIGVALAALFLVSQAGAGQDCSGAPNRCADCGCHKPCQKKVCQVVCEIKKEKKYCWSVECEDFCIALPGCGHGKSRRDPGCGCTDPGCAAAGGCKGACDECQKCTVPPKCCKPCTKKKLVKKEYDVEIPVYKCVVKYLCGDCGDGCAAEAAPAATTPTPAPVPAPAAPKRAPMAPKPASSAFHPPDPVLVAPRTSPQAFDLAPLPPW